MRDVVVCIPGITGSVLRKDGRDIWNISGGALLSALTTLGRSIAELSVRLGAGPVRRLVVPSPERMGDLLKVISRHTKWDGDSDTRVKICGEEVHDRRRGPPWREGWTARQSSDLVAPPHRESGWRKKKQFSRQRD